MRSIYPIEARYINLMNKIDLQDGELTEEDIALLTIHEENYKTAIEQWYYIKKDTDNTILAIDTEIKRLQDLKESKNNLIERVKKIVTEALIKFGNDSDNRKSTSKNYKSELFQVYTVTKPKLDINPVAIWDNEQEIINKFSFNTIELTDKKDYDNTKSQLFQSLKIAVKESDERTIDKDKLKELLEVGEEIKGAYIDTDVNLNTTYTVFK